MSSPGRARLHSWQAVYRCTGLHDRCERELGDGEPRDTGDGGYGLLYARSQGESELVAKECRDNMMFISMSALNNHGNDMLR